MMDEVLPDFDKAVEDFRKFLRERGHPDDLLWVFRDDTWYKALDNRWIRFPVSKENQKLSRRVYEGGKAKGLMSLTALAKIGNHVAVTAWFPKYEEEEVQGWDRGLKLSIRTPLPEAIPVSPVLWNFVTLLPGFRRSFHENDWLIGSKRWAQA